MFSEFIAVKGLFITIHKCISEAKGIIIQMFS